MNLGLTTKTVWACCPHCSTRFSAATSLFWPVKPKPGDFTFCIECAGLAIFADAEGRLRLPTFQDRFTRADRARIQRIQAKLRHAIRLRRERKR